MNLNSKKHSKTNKIIIVFTSFVVVFILLYLSLILTRKYTYVESILKDITTSTLKVVMIPFTSLNKEKDIDQSKSYLIQKNVNTTLEKEIDELKEVLDLNKTLTSYTPVNATILTRNKNYWFQTITIDKGKKEGLKEDLVVVTKNGLVGKISKVSNYSSLVKLVSSDDINFKVSVAITTDTQDTYAILGGYDVKNKCLKVSGVDKTVDVKVGNNVTTSGMGGMFPRGIFIGVVNKVENDKYGISKTLYIKTKQDFNNIHYVTVLKEKDK